MTEEQVQKLVQENEQLRKEVSLLHQKIHLLIKRVFGHKSEQLDPAQLELLFGDLNEDDTPGKPEASIVDLTVEANARPQPKRIRRMRMPKHVPVVEEVIQPLEVQAAPENWRKIGEEVSEQLDYEPGRFLRRRTVRPKYVSQVNREQAPIIAPLPPRLVDRGQFAPGLMTHIVISKYADHLPLYRQESIYRQRHGIELSRESMSRVVEQVAEGLQLIVKEMGRQQFANGYVQIDETPVKYQCPGRGKTAQGYLWATHVPGGDTVYHWYASRGQGCLEDFIPNDFAGVVQCDGYAAYPAFAKRHGDVLLTACWAHARRTFKDALDQGEATLRAGWILRQIGHLYRIESDLRNSRAGPRVRQVIRSSQSRIIIERLRRTLTRLKLKGEHLPQSLMGKAINYTLGQWDGLKAFLDDGRLEIDNNLVENAIRPTAVGKKNWLFIGAEEAGWKSATIYSVIVSCRNRGIDPQAYLKDVIKRLPVMTNQNIHTLTPANWLAGQNSDRRSSLAS